ncbi:MAG TPA: class I SAM-dependent methyltransferase [Alphaproteobacteria bacterium]|jgi:predicted O-methyltransferase YrrM|nr:class I SAM-dependent methyltransferase [Alphaproteobacteria bacterium]HJM49332.1 class I SAM-dependent methyltransferase [Alphaproteobacteria bacterium]
MRDDLAEQIRGIVSAESFAATLSTFETFPEASLLSPASRAFVDGLVRLQRPGTVLEIGTYYGGTSEIIARALADTGSGILLTIDLLKTREAEVHEAMQRWPEAARDITTFVTVGSLDFFKRLTLNPGLRFDLALIDGDHSHAAALTDLIQCARFAANNAVMLVDDFQLPGVNWAVRDFLRLHPEWREISGMFTNGFATASLAELSPSLEEISFLVLLGPDKNGIGARPVSFLRYEFAGAAIAGAGLKFAPDHGGGTLFAMFIIDSVSLSSVETSTRNISRRIEAGQDETRLALEPPLAAHYGLQAEKNNCEMILLWQGENSDGRLDLVAPPEFIVSQNGAKPRPI